MPIDPTALASVTLPNAEWNELVLQVNRSIAWSQAILSKIVLQVQQQQVEPATAEPPPPATNNISALRRPRNAPAADGGSYKAQNR